MLDSEHRNMPNLTLSLDANLLNKVKDAARRENVSVNKFVCDLLADHVIRNEPLSLEDWFAMADRTSSTPDPLPADGGRGWDRDGLYRT